MAWDFGSLKNSLKDFLGIPATDERRLPEAVREKIINIRHREIARRVNISGLVTEYTGTVNTGGYYITLPSLFSTPVSVYVYDPSGDSWDQADGVTYTEFQGLYPNLADPDSRGTPEKWTVAGDKLYVGPPADEDGHLVKLTYNAFPADLVGASDTSYVTSRFGDALLYLSLADAAMYVLEEQRQPVFLQRGLELLDEAIIEESRKIYEGRRPITEEP